MSDPFSRGSYSYAGVGTTVQDYETLATPVAGTLFFAGDATPMQGLTGNRPVACTYSPDACTSSAVVIPPHLDRSRLRPDQPGFAGEHTNTTHMSTTHGALASGQRAAVEVARYALASGPGASPGATPASLSGGTPRRPLCGAVSSALLHTLPLAMVTLWAARAV